MMSVSTSFLAALALAGVIPCSSADGEDLGAYLTEKDGKRELKEPLTLRMEQGGIAGFTGTLWTIEPSGQWQISRFRTDKDGKEQLTPQRSGTLSASQLKSLAEALASQNLASLPEKAGREAKVNPRRVIVKFGKKKATLEGLAPKRNQTIAECIRKSAPENEKDEGGLWERFAQVAQAIETHCPAEQP